MFVKIKKSYNLMKRFRKLRIYTIIGVILLLIFTIWANKSIIKTSSPFITNEISKLKSAKCGLLLGTSRTLKNGKPNDFFYKRINATLELYQKAKIKHIIVSGDNSKKSYNEPLDMKMELIKRGVPDSVIHLDYAGFRTLDSVVRAKEIFGQSTFIIISQKFHNERAVFIARKNGIEAFGYNAEEVTAFNGFKTKLREFFARDKVYLDLLFGVSPKFLGAKVQIN